MLNFDLLLRDLKVALRSLAHTKGLAITVILTLALGIGANAAIFSVVRGVLLRPLVNRDENRLIYIRQSAPGIGVENTTFSVPEIQDLQSRTKTVSEFGDFSTIGFSMVGLGEPREVRAGVVDGSYFEVMGLHPVLGRLLDAHDDGPNAAGAVVLTYRFWTNSLHSDPSVLGKTLKLDTGDPGGARTATIVGVLEPSVPYPAETELIANVVTSPHHLSATMVTGRVHRMTELFGRLAPGADINQARADLRTAYGSMTSQHPEAYPHADKFQISAVFLREQITSRAKTVLWVLLAASILVFVIACSNAANLILARTVRREGELSIRAALGASTASLRRTLLIDSLLLCGAGAARFAGFWPRARSQRGFQHALGGRAARSRRRRAARVRPAPAFGGDLKRIEPGERRRAHHRQHRPPSARLRRHADRRVLHAARRRRHVAQDAARSANRAHRFRHAQRSRLERSRRFLRTHARSDPRFL